MEIKDPAEDREEFEKRLKSIFDWKIRVSVDDVMGYIAANGSMNEAHQSVINSCNALVADYLAQWDAVTTHEEKAAVVASVTME